MQFLGKIIAWRQSVNDKGRKNGPASLLLTTGCGFILIGILYGPCSFPLCFGPLLTLNSGAWCLLGGILMLTAILTARSIIVPIHASGWILPLIAMLLSDLAYRRSSFFQTDYWPLILALAALITYGFLKIERRRAVAFMPALLLIVTAFSGVISFLLESNGRLIFSDDMPPFLYRLMQLKENFPLIPFYNPEWNGGVEAREFFPSGSLNIFFLWFPVIKLADLRSVFTPLVGITVFLFIPACICCAARLLNLGRNAACFAAVLSLCCSIEWYRWSLLYGTLPFITAAGLFPLNVALCIRAAKENFNRLHALVFFCSMSLMAFWTPSLLAIAPVALCTLLHRRAWKENRAFTLVLILLAILHLPWILLFLKASQVGDFILAQQSSEAAALPASVHTAPFSLPALSRHGFMKATLGTIREFTRNTHPLLLFLIVPAFGLTISARSRGYIAAILVTILLSIAGPVVKPQLELQRFYLVAILLLTIPLSQFLESMFSSEKKSGPGGGVRTASLLLAGALLWYCPYWIWKVAANDTFLTYFFAGSIVDDLAEGIRDNSGDGRALFAGFLLHEISGGHAAPLPKFSGKPLVASRYQHDRWRYTDVFPEEYRKRGAEGIEEYLTRLNVSLVVTHEKFWRKWFSKRPELYTPVWEREKFKLFKRNKYEPTYFIDGSGRILSQTGGQLRVRVDTPSAVIKFNYLPILTADNCGISGHRLTPTERFIKVENCTPGTVVRIRAKGPLARLLSR